MLALLDLLLVVAALGAPQMIEDGVPDRHASAERVDRVLATWDGGVEVSEAELVQRLAELGSGAERRLLELFLGRPPNLPARAIVVTLGRVGDSSATVKTLAWLARSPGDPLRGAAIAALGELGKSACLPPLLAGLDDPNVEVRSGSAAALWTLAHQNRAVDLVRALRQRRSDQEHPDHFALLLGRLGSRRARTILLDMARRWFDEPTALAGLSGLWLCGEEDDAAAVVSILTRVSSLAVRRKACLVLGKLGARSAVRDLLDCLRDENPGLVGDAHWALKRLTGLSLNADPALWESWWERAGEEWAARE